MEVIGTPEFNDLEGCPTAFGNAVSEYMQQIYLNLLMQVQIKWVFTFWPCNVFIRRSHFGHAMCLSDTLQAYRSKMHPFMSIPFHRVLLFYCIEIEFHHVLLDGMSNGDIFNPKILTSASTCDLT